MRVRQTDDDGDAQTSATGADQKEEYGWTHSFSVVRKSRWNRVILWYRKKVMPNVKIPCPRACLSGLGVKERLGSV